MPMHDIDIHNIGDIDLWLWFGKNQINAYSEVGNLIYINYAKALHSKSNINQIVYTNYLLRKLVAYELSISKLELF